MEKHNTEWKESWHDRYLNALCGFANAQGGVLEIGRRDDGVVVGLANVKKLLEDLPNKIRSATGIIADIELKDKYGKQYIVISVKPYTFPISCNGKYYYRSGSTTQELSGTALDEFMLKKQGRTWDAVPVPHVRFEEFERDAFKVFRKKAIASGRMTTKDLDITDEMLLKNLRLVDGDYLKRAALLLFHHDPGNWFIGSYVKIGFFENRADLIYQDEVHGPLISMADKVEDLVYTKYFKGIISYQGMQRVETFPVPRIAFREAVLNAIVHADHGAGNPIHIHIYPNEVLIYNNGQLPQDWTVEDLFEKHTSMPSNPLIANAFFRSGQIEAWGRGIEKITDACKEWDKPEPFYRIRTNEVMIGFNTESGIVNSIVENIVDNIVEKNDLTEVQIKIIKLMQTNPKISANVIAEEIGIAPRNVQTHIQSLKVIGMVERKGPAKGGRWVVRE